MSRNRNFCFTWNNYNDDSKLFLATVSCKYVAYSEEVAPNTGTKHLQGYISFNNPKTLSQARITLLGCHVETMLGSISQNEDYCSKVGELIERGQKPVSNDNKGRAEKLRWQRAKELIIQNKKI